MLETCVCHEFYTKNPGRVVSRFDFSALFSEAWKLSMTPKNIISGFQVTGVYPFDRNRVLVQLQESGSKFKPENLIQSTGLAYIPLYSPVCKQSRPDTLSDGDLHVLRQSHSSDLLAGDDLDFYCDNSLLERSLSEGNISRDSTPFKRATSISRFLNTPCVPSKITTKNTKSCGKVLTSLENINLLEQKKKAKEKEQQEKEERKAQRAAKAKAKLQKKGSKGKMLLCIYISFNAVFL